MKRRARLIAAGCVVAGLGVSWAGCVMTNVVTVPVKLAATTVVAVGETAGTVVKTTGRVAASAVRATGAVADGGISAAGKLARAGMVTFVDVATGSVVRVPWRQGLTLAGGAQAARVRVAARAIQVIRAGQLAYAVKNAGTGPLPLAAGDVVRIGAGG
ncbi:MAG: hypothetical protein H7343_09650 [Undibacterium sp.]|nr:hypothetical protein [Opitutaceae bacterium]